MADKPAVSLAAVTGRRQATLELPLGYPQGTFGPNRRRPTSETTFLDRWGASVPWK